MESTCSENKQKLISNNYENLQIKVIMHQI